MCVCVREREVGQTDSAWKNDSKFFLLVDLS